MKLSKLDILFVFVVNPIGYWFLATAAFNYGQSIAVGWMDIVAGLKFLFLLGVISLVAGASVNKFYIKKSKEIKVRLRALVLGYSYFAIFSFFGPVTDQGDLIGAFGLSTMFMFLLPFFMLGAFWSEISFFKKSR